MKDTGGNEASNQKKSGNGVRISAKQLAFLAAILSPEECKSGAAGSALRHAFALFEESDELLRNLCATKTLEQRLQIADQTPGGEQLFKVWSRQIEAESNRPLRLDAGVSSSSDEVRDYLSKHCNLEGKRGAGWKTVRTVWANFTAMFMCEANEHNKSSKERIIAAEKLTSELNRGNAGAGSQPSRLLYKGEQWKDWENTLKDFKSDAARYSTKTGLLTHYEIRPHDLYLLAVWKHEIKDLGGMKAVKPRTREEILGPPPPRRIIRKRRNNSTPMGVRDQ